MQQCYKYQKFPRYQYTARDIKTGATFIALAYEKTSTNSTIFSQLVFNHLEKFNINSFKLIMVANLLLVVTL